MCHARTDRIVLASLAVMLMVGLGSGCGRKPAPPPPPPPDTPFQRVMDNVDSGGDLLVVANLEGIVQQCVTAISQDLTTAAAGDPKIQPAADIAKRVNAFLLKNGFYAVRGYGMSVVPRSNDWNVVKFFVSRDPAAAKLPLWRGLVGGEPRVLTSLNFLPADTVMVHAGSEDLNQLWQLVESGVADCSTPKIAASFKKAIGELNAKAGVELQSLFQSLGEGGFVSIQLSRDATLSLPLSSKPLSMPEPSILIAMAVKDDTILKLLDAQLAKAKMPLATKQVGETTLRSLALPVPMPMPVQPTYTLHAGHLLFGSSEKVVTDALTAFQQRNGLIITPEFAKAFAGLPMTNNGLIYYSPRLVTCINELQQNAMETATALANASKDAALTQVMMRNMTRWNGMPACAFVIVNTEQGVRTLGASSTDAKALIVQSFMSPLGLMAAIAIPSFMKARTTSQQNACINNLRMFEAAKDQWALETGTTNGAPVTMKDIAPYLKHPDAMKCPGGGQYKLNAIGNNAVCNQMWHRLP